MDAKEATRRMIDSSDMSPAEIGAAMGKSRTYVYTLKKQNSAPGIAAFARLAHACGYRLMLQRDDGKEIELYSPADAEDYTENVIHNAGPRPWKPGTKLPEGFKDLEASYGAYDDGWNAKLLDVEQRLRSDPDFKKRHEGESEVDLEASAYGEAVEALRAEWHKAENDFFQRDSKGNSTQE